MAKRLQLRRGTTSQHSAFTGAAGEVTVDTDKKVVVVHDGSTAGGIPMAKDSVKVDKVTSTDNAVVRFDGTTGQVQNSGVIIDDNSNLSIGNGGALRGSRGAGNIGTNLALGDGALQSNTTGSYNTANGVNALTSNTTGSSNTANGRDALYSNTTGSDNTANGRDALLYNTTGSGNIAIGSLTSGGSYSPAYNITTENNYISMGSTSVTNAYIQVAWTVASDKRDKTEFAEVPHGLDFVSKLKPTAFRYKESREATEGHGGLRYGFLAQDVLELEGSSSVIVDSSDEDRLRFNDSSLIAVLVKAVQELREEVEILKGK